MASFSLMLHKNAGEYPLYFKKREYEKSEAVASLGISKYPVTKYSSKFVLGSAKVS
jgi:hypothetical protein